MEYIDKLINEEESTQENVHRVVTGEMDGEEITRDETVYDKLADALNNLD